MATSDEEMESLVQSFDRIYEGYKDAVSEIQTLKSSYDSEVGRRQALQLALNDLNTDNERLRRLYNESLTRLTNQIKYHTKLQSLKEELKKSNDRILCLEAGHSERIKFLKQENEMNIQDLEKRVSRSLVRQEADEAVIKQLQQELASHKTQVDNLTNTLEYITSNMDSKYDREIQDFKDWILVEQEEKRMLQEKLQESESHLQIIKTKQVEQQRDSISIRHVETLKQKIMKLRKENESLKRQLVNSKP